MEPPRRLLLFCTCRYCNRSGLWEGNDGGNAGSASVQRCLMSRLTPLNCALCFSCFSSPSTACPYPSAPPRSAPLRSAPLSFTLRPTLRSTLRFVLCDTLGSVSEVSLHPHVAYGCSAFAGFLIYFPIASWRSACAMYLALFVFCFPSASTRWRPSIQRLCPTRRSWFGCPANVGGTSQTSVAASPRIGLRAIRITKRIDGMRRYVLEHVSTYSSAK